MEDRRPMASFVIGWRAKARRWPRQLLTEGCITPPDARPFPAFDARHHAIVKLNEPASRHAKRRVPHPGSSR
jgi:hypothetical protein